MDHLAQAKEQCDQRGQGDQDVLLRNDQLRKKAEKKEQGKRNPKKGKGGNPKKGKGGKPKKGKGGKPKKGEGEECKPRQKKARAKTTQKESKTKKTNLEQEEKETGKTEKKGGGRKGVSRKRKTLKIAASSSSSRPKSKRVQAVQHEPVAPLKARKRSKEANVPVQEPVKPAKKVRKDPLKGSKAQPQQDSESSRPKAKARGRKAQKPKGGEGGLDNEALTKELAAFARQFDPETNLVADGNFRDLLRSKTQLTPECDVYRLNIYWSRHACGVTNKIEKKDTHNFSFNGAEAADVHRLAIAVRCAELTAT